MDSASRSDAAPVLSFRHILTEALARFLDEHGLNGPETAEALGELMVSLSRYREEGAPLFPQVFLGDSCGQILEALRGQDPIRIGQGPCSRETMRRVLKQCAPLSIDDWNIWLVREPDGFSWGLFRTESFPLSETTFERLRALQERTPRIIGVQQLAENVLELRASGGESRYFYLSGARLDSPLPSEVMEDLVEELTRDVAPELHHDAMGFFRRVLNGVMQAPHGALVAVLPMPRTQSPLFGDGIVLKPPIDVAARILAYRRDPTAQSAAALQSLVPLLHGMMGSDGITVFRSDGALLASNVFVRHTPTSVLGMAPIGGARRRTYDMLCEFLGGELSAAFYRSQDGHAECRRAK